VRLDSMMNSLVLIDTGVVYGGAGLSFAKSMELVVVKLMTRAL